MFTKNPKVKMFKTPLLRNQYYQEKFSTFSNSEDHV